MDHTQNRRILIVDDNEAIHQDFKKILVGNQASQSGLKDARAAFFGGTPEVESKTEEMFHLEWAGQGMEALEMVTAATEKGLPYAVAFVDVRMPPGWDGIQTIARLWRADPTLQVVICTAYSDYSFDDIVETLGHTDRLLILKKPFDPVEVRQLAESLSEKWNITLRERQRIVDLQRAEQHAREHAHELVEINHRLEEANARAEAANVAKSEFLANMSHEIRTPLTAILGYVDLLCDAETSTETRREYKYTVRDSGGHLLTILNDILDLSKIEARSLRLNEESFSPLNLLKDVVELLRPRASEKKLELSVSVVDKVPRMIVSDAVRVRQILINLLGNAIKFTETGSIKVEMGIGPPSLEHAPKIYIQVKDTGIGIDADAIPKLFAAFSQADTSHTRAAGGTGLGLAISKRLARLLGGDIQVQSTPGEGSTFTVSLTCGEIADLELADASELDLEERAPQVRPATAISPALLNGSILLVEDARLNQVLISTILRKAGASVNVAENGLIGTQLVAEAARRGSPYNLILMDMQMPVLDGYAATRQLRNEGYTTPIVALTAHAMQEDRQRCIDAGCTEYATKPIDRKELVQLCARLLQDAVTAPLPSESVEGQDSRRATPDADAEITPGRGPSSESGD